MKTNAPSNVEGLNRNDDEKKRRLAPMSAWGADRLRRRRRF